MNLKGRNFLTLKDYTGNPVSAGSGGRIKGQEEKRDSYGYLKGKNVALIFEKTSTRTRCAFEVAAHDLGMGSTYLDPSGSQIGKKKVLQTQPEFLAECTMELSTEALDRRL